MAATLYHRELNGITTEKGRVTGLLFEPLILPVRSQQFSQVQVHRFPFIEGHSRFLAFITEEVQLIQSCTQI